jgi:hypothetical protein
MKTLREVVMLIYVLVIPLFMMADYYLTLLGNKISKEYREHFAMKDYEVNPLWQKDVSRQKWFNPKQLALVAAFTAIFYFFIQYLYDRDYILMQLMMGMITAPYAIILGRHLSNLLLFSFVRKNPGILEGKLMIPYQYMLATSRIMVVPGIFMFIVIYAFTQDFFVLGGTIGSVILFCVHFIWALKARKMKKL